MISGHGSLPGLRPPAGPAWVPPALGAACTACVVSVSITLPLPRLLFPLPSRGLAKSYSHFTSYGKPSLVTSRHNLRKAWCPPLAPETPTTPFPRSFTFKITLPEPRVMGQKPPKYLYTHHLMSFPHFHFQVRKLMVRKLKGSENSQDQPLDGVSAGLEVPYGDVLLASPRELPSASP